MLTSLQKKKKKYIKKETIKQTGSKQENRSVFADRMQFRSFVRTTGCLPLGMEQRRLTLQFVLRKTGFLVAILPHAWLFEGRKPKTQANWHSHRQWLERS